MQTNLYIPKTIRVGFQKRSDTFTGMLGFVTYLDDKGELRQEKSWNGWRDKKIAVQEFDNVPRSNFVFNKDVHRSGHWSSHSKVRIHDSRDFEFEIELSNMMYILMHSDVSKRDIQEECVFAWSGRDLILLPVNSEEYQKSIEHTRKQQVKFSLKDLVQGHTYSTKSHEEYIYLGYYDWCEKDYGKGWKNKGKKHVFYKEKKQSWEDHFVPLSGNELCECVNNDIHQKYSHFITALMKTQHIQKLGKFTIKKGFEKIGYKNTAYENMIVTLIDGQKPDFKIEMAEFKIDNDQPKIVRIKQDRGYYYRDHNTRKKEHYQSIMREKGINGDTLEELKQYFETAGFGTLYYIDADGKKEVVTEK